MTDDTAERAAARALLDVVVAGEPPLPWLRPDDLVRIGKRRRLGRRVLGAGSVLAAAAGVAAVVLLAGTAGPARPVADRPTVIVRPPVRPAPTASGAVTSGPVDVLTPAREKELVRVNGATFRQAYRPPPGWRVRAWVPFVDDPGLSDASWDGGAVLVDSAGRLATVLVAVSVPDPVAGRPGCPGEQTVPLPGGGLGHLSRDGKTIAVCMTRARGGLVVSASSGPGNFPVQKKTDVPAPAAPETPAGLAALAANAGFRWPG
jgi:hypothetical protein